MESMTELCKLEPAERRARARELLAAHPLRVPVLLLGLERQLPPQHRQLLVPRSFKVTQFGMKVRKLTRLGQDDSLFFFTERGLLQQDKLMRDVYEEGKDADEFLYVRVSSVPAFGAAIRGL